jgi:hypothetical protein
MLHLRKRGKDANRTPAALVGKAALAE